MIFIQENKYVRGLKNKMKKEKTRIEEHHHHYNWDRIIWQILVFLVVAVLVGSFSELIGENKTVYRQCTNTCSEKHFMGTQLGRDINIKTIKLQKGDGVQIYNPTVIEFDRTDCIKSCNYMYLDLRGK